MRSRTLMNKYKYFLKNVGILTIASLGTKLISFFIVPLYTSVLSTAEYGTYDLLNTTIILLVPILTFNVNESVLRFCLDNKYNRKHLLSISLKYFISGLLLLTLFITLNYSFHFIEIINIYPIMFILLYMVSALASITTAYARGIDRVSDVAISGIIGAGLTLILNILLLAVLKWGLQGYLWSTIIGTFIQNMYIIVRSKLWKEIKLFVQDKALEKIILSYSIPLMVNSFAWWVNSASDRYVITLICGLNENGIYSVAYKIPTLLTMFNVIFNQAWIISAVKEYDNQDNDRFFSNIYNAYNVIMVIFCSILIVLNKYIAYILFKNEFYAAWKYSPYLLISVVFGAISGYMGGVFSTVNKTNITAITVGAGAITNVILNIILVNKIGVLGAAIATVISYIVVWVIRLVAVKKMIYLEINLKKDLVCYLILFAQAILYNFIESSEILYPIEVVLCIIIILVYRMTWCKYFNGMKVHFRRRKIEV